MHRFLTARLGVPALGFVLLLIFVPTASIGAQAPYPPNTVVSTYVDARYCGDGNVSVVTDSSGDLINVCTSTGVRIYPIAAGGGAYGAPIYNPAIPSGAPYAPFNPAVPGTAPYTVPPYSTGNGYLPPGYGIGGYNGTNGTNGSVIRQYNDGNSNCPNGDVTQTTSGFYCTANGAPAAANGSVPAYSSIAPGFAPYTVPPYTTGTGNLPPGYGTSGFNGTNGYNGTVIRQYNDANTNCPNGDVTQTTGGYYCTANGQPAARVG